MKLLKANTIYNDIVYLDIDKITAFEFPKTTSSNTVKIWQGTGYFIVKMNDDIERLIENNTIK